MRFKIHFLHYGKAESLDCMIVANDHNLPAYGENGYYEHALTAKQALNLSEALRLAANAAVKLAGATPKIETKTKDADDSLPI